MKAERRILPALAAVVAMLGAAACDDDDPEGPTPTIAVAVSPATLSVQQGQSGTATVTVTRTNFTNNVALSVEGAPTGVTATVSPASLTGTTNSATVTVNVGAAAAAGNSTLTIRATGTGVTDATATMALTVTAAPAGSYTMAVTPTSATVAQGGSTTATVNLTRMNSFAGEVSLAASGLPTGVTATFDPAATTGNTSTVTLNAAANATVGAATVTITGTATGLANQTATIALTVTETTTGGNVSWTFCPAFDVPAWVAYRDGDGEWVRALADDTDPDSYLMQFDEDRGAVAYATEDDGESVVSVFYGLRAELEAQGGNLCEGTGETITVTGSVDGLEATDQAYVTMGSATALLLPGVGTDFTLDEVETGPRDLVAARVAFDVSGDEPALTIEELIIRRGLQPADNDELPVLDFDSDEAFEPVSSNVTVANANGDPTFVISGYFTENGVLSGFFTGLPSMGEAMTYAGIPADRQEAGDLHLLSVVAIDDAEDPTSTRIVQEFFMEAGDRTATLGPELGAVTVTSINGADYPRLQAMYSPQDEYNQYYLVSFAQPDHQWLLAATQGFVGAGNDVELVVPDFGDTDGWDPDAWALEDGVQTDWFFSASGWTAEGGVVMSPFVEGGLFRTATRMGTVTP